MNLEFNDIDQALQYFENKNFSEKAEEEFMASYPSILSYLTSSQFEPLTEDEFLILMFDAMVILKAYQNKLGKTIDPDGDLIEKTETTNWDNFEELGKMPLEEKMFELFEDDDSPLAEFIISTLEDEDEEEEDSNDEINFVVKEIIFISLKTISDCIKESDL
ncbi:MAG: hypothetical protein R2771_09540 [Saprospiraceae bacterium]